MALLLLVAPLLLPALLLLIAPLLLMATLLLPALLLRVPSLLLVAPLQLMSPLLLPPRTPHQNASRQSSPARVLQTVQPMAVLSRRSPIAASTSKPPTDQPNKSPRVSQHLHQQRTQGCFQRCPFKGQVCRRRDCSLPTTAAPAQLLQRC